MEIEDQEWVIHTLKDYERRRCISKVLSVECKDAVAKGNNYGSDMKRLRLRVVLKSGNIVTKSVILKAIPSTETRRSFIRGMQLHTKESKMFREVLPQIEGIRKEKQEGVERISPICYGIMTGAEGCLLEDLNETGFKMADRRKGLDFQHGELVVKSMAEFHAATKVLMEKGDLQLTDDFTYNFFLKHPDQMKPVIIDTLKQLRKTVEEVWKGEWLDYASSLQELVEHAIDKFCGCLEHNESNFNTIVHGDCWMTNMMFKCDSNGQPQDMRFLDFQLCNYNSVGNELQYFFHTSLTAEALSRTHELLRIYHDKLVRSLELYGYSGTVPSFDDILECYKRSANFGMLIGLSFRPMVMQPEDQVPDDLEQWTKEFFNEGWSTQYNMNEDNLRRVLQFILKSAREDGLL